MYRALLTLLLSASSLGVAAHYSQDTRNNRDPNRGWRAAMYRGLTIGQSTRADMVRVLGEPLLSVPSADQDEPIFVWNDYGIISGDLSGRLAVEIDSRTEKIVGISISPENMSREDAIRYFGDGHTLMGYEFCEGFEDEINSPIYESPNSSDISYVEYRSRGIAIHIGDRGVVNAIYFVSEPVGLGSKEDCGREAERLRNGNH